MNYYAHYSRLIERAKGRILAGYSEKHHVLPKCVGGTNEPKNIVQLTPEEHYVAHQLLVKMNPGDHRLLWAASAMTGKSKKQPGRRNKLYGWLRRRLSEETRRRATGRVMSAEARAKMSAAKRGKIRAPHTAETKAKMSAASKGKSKSPEHVAAMSAERLGKKRKPHSAATKKQMSRVQRQIASTIDRSYAKTDEYKELQSQKMQEVWEKRRAGLIAPRRPRQPKHIKE